MKKNDDHKNNTAFLDLLFNLLIGIFALWILSFLLISPKIKKDNIKTYAEFIITVTWPDSSRDDVDTWLQDPLGNVCFFRNTETAMMSLDRDDRGEINDVVKMPDGRYIIFPHNQEVTTIRGFISGEWILNIHMYKKRAYAEPTWVEVSIDKLNPTVKKVFFGRKVLVSQWQEETVARFTMLADGGIVNWDDLPKDIVRERQRF